MPKRAGHTDLVHMIRGSAIKALRELDQRGSPLWAILEKQFEERPLETLQAISRFLPKEVALDVNASETWTEVLRGLQQRAEPERPPIDAEHHPALAEPASDSRH